MTEINSMENTTSNAEVASRDMETSTTPGDLKKQTFQILGSGFFIGTLVLTGYYYWSNNAAKNELMEIEAKTASYQSQVNELKADPSVLSAEVLMTQKDAIVKTIEQSNPAIYLRELEAIYKDQGVSFRSFNFSKNKVTTVLVVQRGADDDAVRKLIKLIAGYRGKGANMGSQMQTNTASGSIAPMTSSGSTASGSLSGTNARPSIPEKPGSIFTLGPILSVSGDQGERTVNIEFTIK